MLFVKKKFYYFGLHALARNGDAFFNNNGFLVCVYYNKKLLVCQNIRLINLRLEASLYF